MLENCSRYERLLPSFVLESIGESRPRPFHLFSFWYSASVLLESGSWRTYSHAHTGFPPSRFDERRRKMRSLNVHPGSLRGLALPHSSPSAPPSCTLNFTAVFFEAYRINCITAPREGIKFRLMNNTANPRTRDSRINETDYSWRYREKSVAGSG